MAQKPKLRTENWLRAIKAVDLTERVIRAQDHIEAHCYLCNTIGSIKANNADQTLKKNGYAYCCFSCKKNKLSASAKNRVGDKNPFYGKKHKQESLKKMSINARVHKTSAEDNKAHAAKMRDAAARKYGQNPMLNQLIKDKHKEITSSDRFRKRAEEIGKDKAKHPLFRSEMKSRSVEFWNSNESEQSRQKLKDRISDLQKSNAEWAANNPELLFSSKAEKEILDWIRSQGLLAQKHRFCSTEIDIYIPSVGLGIEYNGLYWHSEARKKEPNYHLNKTNECLNNNINLIHVFEHEWRDRNSQVKSFLRSKLGLNKNKIGARECIFKEIETKEANRLIDRIHIQGANSRTSYAIGCFYNNQLVCAATFGRHHRKGNGVVLNRFACEDDYTVAGSLSKISKLASNHFKQDIISWADLRWSTGNGYTRAGWQKESVLKPDYFYTDFVDVFPKQARMKSKVGTPNGMTEHEHALLDKLYRVWDCGKIRFVYKYNPA